VGGTRYRHFDGTSFKPRKVPENAQTPTTTPALHQTQCGASVAPAGFAGDWVHHVRKAGDPFPQKNVMSYISSNSEKWRFFKKKA